MEALLRSTKNILSPNNCYYLNQTLYRPIYLCNNLIVQNITIKTKVFLEGIGMPANCRGPGVNAECQQEFAV